MGELITSFKSSVLGVIFFFGGLWFCGVAAQNRYLVFGKASVTEGSISGINAQLKTDNSSSSLQVNEKGEFKCELNWNQDYLFVFSKKGYIAKSIRFSTEVPANVNRNAIEPYMLLVELSPVMANVDTAFFENPVGFIRFDVSVNDFDFDRDYSLKVKYSNPVQKKHNNRPVVQNKENPNLNKNNKTAPTTQPTTNETIEPKKVVSKPKTLYAPDFPPLLDEYPPGITREEFNVPGRQVTRVVLNENRYLKVLLKVKHDWGVTFYFINEAPDYYRGISRETFIKLAGGE